jgi:two-component system, NtrC family, nitrogen regulation sensor histidine kinase NtrY
MNNLLSWLKPEARLLLKIIFLASFCFGICWLITHEKQQIGWLLSTAVIWLTIDLFIMMKKTQEEVQDFAEAVKYREFSRSFNLKDAPIEVKKLRKGFNDINSAFRVISRERETQYQYLQQILELVDIGILSFDLETGDQQWMNMAFKKMLDLPYLKNIHALQKRDPSLLEEIMAIRPGESRIVNLHSDNRMVKAVMVCTIFQTGPNSNKLIAFQNINSALDETEARAWQKLLSVMTHEIMNSVAPISSLAATLKKIVSQKEADANGEKADLELGLETIQRRSEGLLKFAETYRSLNKILKPNLEEVYIRDIFENLITLMQPTLDQKSIEIDVVLKDPKLVGSLDLSLVEQVMINLLVNATEAVKDQPHPKITLSAYQKNNRLLIRIADNGQGIESEILEKIFIPFFSTKKSGSGIGLSLCKQIMLLHKGNIQVQSIVGEGTVFELVF